MTNNAGPGRPGKTAERLGAIVQHDAGRPKAAMGIDQILAKYHRTEAAGAVVLQDDLNGQHLTPLHRVR